MAALELLSKNRTVSKGKQDISFKEVIRLGKAKLKISIKSDSYDFQSYARIEIFEPTEMKWNFLDHIPYAEMSTPSGLSSRYYSPTSVCPESVFDGDRNKLVKLARDVLEE